VPLGTLDGNTALDVVLQVGPALEAVLARHHKLRVR
jgi:hypothetical protein